MADISRDARFDFEGRLAGDLSKSNLTHADQLRGYLAADRTGKAIPSSFWDSVQGEQQRLLAIYLLLVWRESSTRHKWTGDAMVSRGRQWSQARAVEVAQGFVDTSRAMVDTATAAWGEREQPPTQAEIDDRVESVFGPTRTEGIAITEVSNAVTDASETAMAEQDLTGEGDIWWTMQDKGVCDHCEPLHETPRSVWSRSDPRGPPAHPRCRCWISYEADDERPTR